MLHPFLTAERKGEGSCTTSAASTLGASLLPPHPRLQNGRGNDCCTTSAASMLGASLFPHVLTAEKKREILLHDKRRARAKGAALHCFPPFLAAERKGEDCCTTSAAPILGASLRFFPTSWLQKRKRERLLHDKPGVDIACFIAFPYVLIADRGGKDCCTTSAASTLRASLLSPLPDGMKEEGGTAARQVRRRCCVLRCFPTS